MKESQQSFCNSPSACFNSTQSFLFPLHLGDLQSQAMWLPKLVQICKQLFCKWDQESFLTHPLCLWSHFSFFSNPYPRLTCCFFFFFGYSSIAFLPLIPPPHFYLNKSHSSVSFLHSSPIYSLISSSTEYTLPLSRIPSTDVSLQSGRLFVTFIKASSYVRHVASLSFFLLPDGLVPAA